MKCKCRDTMKLYFAWDDAENFAFNLWACECGKILKENVWDNKGLLWINIDSSIEVEQ